MSPDPLALLLDDLLPGGEGFPPGHAIGLADWLACHPDWAEAAQAVLAALPHGFVQADPAGREGMLRCAESADPALFGRMLTGVYTGYYINPVVRTVIAARSGYPARPPQPEGYALPPFDPALLETVRRRPPSYRE
jgi:hypothetical protein